MAGHNKRKVFWGSSVLIWVHTDPIYYMLVFIELLETFLKLCSYFNSVYFYSFKSSSSANFISVSVHHEIIEQPCYYELEINPLLCLSLCRDMWANN